MTERLNIEQSILEQFKARFPDTIIKSREGPGKKVKGVWKKQTFFYVPTDHLHERLDNVCGLNWNWEVLGHTIVNINKVSKIKVDKEDGSYEWKEVPKSVDQVVVWGRLSIYVKKNETLDKVIYREAFGGCDSSYGSQAGDSFKIADSNAFKKACYKFGIGRYLGLEGLEDDSETEITTYQPKKSNPYNKMTKKTASRPNIFKNKQQVDKANPFTKN